MPLYWIGAFSEYAAVSENAAAKVPEYLSDEEAVKALTGGSRPDLKVVSAMLLKHREKMQAAQREMKENRNRAEQEDPNKKAAMAQADELRTRGEMYDGPKDEIRLMIIGRMAEWIDAEEDNRITIRYRVSLRTVYE